MIVKNIIKLNNEKRKELTEDNTDYYEDMLVYIRLSSSKSEQQTEEILLELLEHILLAQEEGRTVKDVFGEDLKQYCQELIEEIPSETRSKQLRFSMYISLIFLAMASLSHGILASVLYYFFDLGAGMITFSIGSGITIVILSLLSLLLVIVYIFKWLKASVFKDKKQKNWIEFMQLWITFTLSTGVFLLIIYFIPDFGPSVSIPTIAFAGIGVVLYLIARLFKE